MRFGLLSISILALISASAKAAEQPLVGRAETNWRYGSERSILMSEFWVPFAQGESLDNVLYGSLRMMGDDQENREGNLGVGYRHITKIPILGDGISGANAWFDRRISARGSHFNQATLGTEWLGENLDFRLNGYIPLSSKETYIIPNANPKGPEIIGTGIYVDTDATLIEEPQHGLDLELGVELGQFSDGVVKYTDSLRVYGGGYYFNSDNTERITGWRTRFTADISQNVQIGARFQKDDERGSQGFLEATIRFPFGHKKSYRAEGLRARLDESPERDIDIVTADKVVNSGERVAVKNTATGQSQTIITVDNTATAGGDGSAEKPFDTLAAAQVAAGEHAIIYVRKGDGTSTKQDQGIVLDKTGQLLIGSGVDFVFDASGFTTENGLAPKSILLAAATSAPVITNINVNGDGISVSANDVVVTGVSVDGASRDGIVVSAAGANSTAENVTIKNVTTTNNRFGIYAHGENGGSVSAKVEQAVAINNTQHGIAVYDDTNNTFDVDLGGGSLGSSGHNVLMGNTLEDLAVEYDGREISAKYNWWGQASGADTDDQSIGIRPQIYYGAPINEGLAGHWTFDSEWVNSTTAYDRSGQGRDASLLSGLSESNVVNATLRQGLSLDNPAERHAVDLGLSNLYIPSVNAPITLWFVHTPDSIDTASLANRLISIRQSSGSSSLALAVGGDDNITYFTQNTGTQFLGDTTIASGEFLKSALTFDGATFRAYTNGVQDGNVVAGTLTSGGAQSAYLGAYSGANLLYDGVIEDVRIYNRALSADEISALNRMDTSASVNTAGYLTSAP